MKKKLLMYLIIVSLFCFTAYAQQYNDEKDFQVEKQADGKSVWITKYVGTSKTVNIPPQIQGMAVTGIEKMAFNEKEITSVKIPNSVTTIGGWAFGENQLTSVTIPNGITSMESGVFAGNKLTNVTIPNSVTTIKEDAFAGNKLTSVTIPDRVKTIERGAFAYNNLTSVIIPNSVTTIGNNAFYINQLTSIFIPKSVTKIGLNVFLENQLTAIIIGTNVNLEEIYPGGEAYITSSFNDSFDDFYNKNGKRAGIYTLNNNKWSWRAVSATHRTKENLRLRENYNTSSNVVTTMLKGTEVQIFETGPNDTIDGITAPWVRVVSGTGFVGWCFSGYLVKK